MTDDVQSRLAATLSDRYQIEREIGSGGMATVYLAEDLKLHRKVALKVLRPDLAAALGADRFLQEIRIAAKLHHPHILQLYDSGEADGFLYYVMPYEEGQSLRERLAKESELPIAEAVRILRDVVDALSDAHEHGVVHRDIKPDNVLLAKHHALVTDFGVAKAISKATGRHKFTTEGVALGTPTYMAPEQAAADPHIDHRADIYAVGAVAYELLTGRPPFTGSTQQEILSAHVTLAPEPVTKYRETVPPALAQLVMKCLEKKAADRWQTAEELLPQLDALATPSGGITPTGMLPVVAARRGWKVATAAGVVAVVLAVVLVITLLPSGGDANLNPDLVAVAVFRNATGDQSLDQVGERAAHWITQGLQQATIKVTPWDGSFQAWQYVQSEVDAGRVREPTSCFAQETGARTVVSGVVYLENDSLEIHVNVTDAERGEPLGAIDPVKGPRASASEVITEMRQSVMGFLAVNFDERISSQATVMMEPPSFDAYSEFDRGLQLYLRSGGGGRNAIPHFRRAFEIDTTFVTPLIYATLIHNNNGEWAQSDSLVDIVERHQDELNDYDRSWLGYLKGRVDGDQTATLQAIRRAAELAPASKAVYNHAWIALRTNRPREALKALLSLDPERGPMRGWDAYHRNVVWTYRILDEHEKALEAAKRFRETFGDTWRTLTHEALALAVLGRVDEADTLLDNLIALPEGGINQGWWILYMAAYLRRDGLLDVAQNTIDRAIHWYESRSPDIQTSVEWRIQYAWSLYVAGRCDEAYSVAKPLPEEFPRSIDSQGLVGILAACRGDSQEAHRVSQWLEALDWPYLRGDHTGWRSVIAAALGDAESAVPLWRQATDQGFLPQPWDPRLVCYESIRDHPEFQELMRPKG